MPKPSYATGATMSDEAANLQSPSNSVTFPGPTVLRTQVLVLTDTFIHTSWVWQLHSSAHRHTHTDILLRSKSSEIIFHNNIVLVHTVTHHRKEYEIFMVMAISATSGGHWPAPHW